MQDVRMPEWINGDKEQKCYKEIMEIAKKIHAECLIAEKDNIRY